MMRGLSASTCGDVIRVTASVPPLKRYPLPSTVSMYCGFTGSSPSARRIFLIAVLMLLSVSKKTSLPQRRSMISSRLTNLPLSRTKSISKSIGMRSTRTGLPARVSS